MLKRKLIFLAVPLLLLLLAGCSVPPLPENYDATTVEQKATEALQYLVARDYASVSAMVRADLQEALSPETLENAWSGKADALGEYKSCSLKQLFGTEGSADGKTYGGAIMTAVFDSKSVIFTFTFDADYQLVGLYIN